jgi:hypothetical protein
VEQVCAGQRRKPRHRVVSEETRNAHSRRTERGHGGMRISKQENASVRREVKLANHNRVDALTAEDLNLGNTSGAQLINHQLSNRN